MPPLTSLFKSRYPNLAGRDWVRQLSEEDLKFFVELGNMANDHGRMGGQARAEGARRINGKFVRADGTYQPYPKKSQENWDDPIPF